MQNIDQVFLYMKDEIERQAKNEEKAILDEVQALENEAYESIEKILELFFHRFAFVIITTFAYPKGKR